LCLIFFIFLFSCHIPGYTECISHLPPFWVFLAIFHFLQCVFLILHDFQFSHHIPGSTVCFYHCPRFTVFLPIYQDPQSLRLIFHVFQFSCHNPGPTVCFSSFLKFLSVSCHISCPTVWVFHFP
jgi:hypothetical protein